MKVIGSQEIYCLTGINIMLILILCATSCKKKPESKGATSVFAQNVNSDRYQESAPPDASPIFKWDFGKKEVHTYTYEQEVRNKSDMGLLPRGNSNEILQEMSAKGILLIKSQGNGTGEFVLKDIKMRMIINLEKGKEPMTMDQEMPAIVAQGMKEDGSVSLADSSHNMALQLLFPLPSKSLKIGESVDIPEEMPFNAMGSLLQVKGRSRITLTRYVKIRNRLCAQLDVDTDISEIKTPPELKGEYICSTKGTSVFYFDVAKRSFVSGVIAVAMMFIINAPMPEIKTKEKGLTNIPKMAKTSMTSDNMIKIELKE